MSLIMNRCLALPMLIVLAGVMSAQQSTTADSSQTSAPDTQNAAHGIVPVRLSTSIESKKAKEGAEVVTKTAAMVRLTDGTVIPSGAKVIGHLTEATAISKGDSQSSLGMVFDKIQMAGGKELSIKGTVLAIAPGEEIQTGAAGTGTIPAYGQNAATMPPPMSQGDSGTGKNSTPVLNAQSRGVVGFRDLTMGLDSLLTSPAKQIRLNNGTQLMLNVQFEYGSGCHPLCDTLKAVDCETLHRP